MASNVKFQDFSFDVKAAIDEETIAWLRTWSNEIASQAQRNCSKEGWGNDERTNLRGSYAARVDESAGKAFIGSPMEAAFWEEWGTGSHADTSKNGGKEGRKGWWVYTPGSSGPNGYKSNVYHTQNEAEIFASYIRKKYNKEAVVTNGREPNYTLEKAFIKVKPQAVAKLNEILKRRLGK